MNTSNWDNERSLELISEYKKHEILWNSKHTAYYNLQRKEEVWREMSERMDVNIDDLKRKLESLRGSYRREKTRMKRRNRFCEGDTYPIYTSPWFAYESMTFLDDRKKGWRETTLQTKIEIEEHEVDDKTLVAPSDIEVIIEGVPENTQQDKPAESSNNSIVSRKLLARKNRKIRYSAKTPIPRRRQHDTMEEDPRLGEAYNILKNAAAVTDRDECSIFCEHVANKLRTFDECSRAVAQHKISNILFEIEMKKFNATSSQ